MIYHNNVDLQKACGAQIVVAAVKTLNGLTREDYAYRLINEWGVGDKTGNNGVVLLLAIEEDDYYLTTGTGLERHLDAGTIKTILDEYLEPDFASKNYDDGVRKTFEAIFTRVNSACTAVSSSSADLRTAMSSPCSSLPMTCSLVNATSIRCLPIAPESVLRMMASTSSLSMSDSVPMVWANSEMISRFSLT